MADHARFTLDGHEVFVDRDDDGELRAHVLIEDGADFTPASWRELSSRIQTAIESGFAALGAIGG